MMPEHNNPRFTEPPNRGVQTSHPFSLGLTRFATPDRAGVFFFGLAAFFTLFFSAAEGAKPFRKVTAILAEEKGEATIIRVKTTARPIFTVFKLDRPQRLHLDLAQSVMGNIESPQHVQTWAVSQIAVHQFQTAAAPVTRVMINLRRPVRYFVKSVGHALVITITPEQSSRPSAEAKDEAVRASAEQHPRQNVPENKELPQDVAFAHKQAAEAQAQALQIRKEGKRVEKELAQARALSQQLQEEAKESRRQWRSRLKAVKAARSKAEQERQQVLADRLLAEQEKKQAAAELALLKQQKKEAEAARLVAEQQQQEARAGRILAEVKQGPDSVSARSSAASSRVKDVRFVDQAAYAAVEILYQGPRLACDIQRQGQRSVLQLKGVKLPRLLQRTLDTSAFTGPIKQVTSFNSPQGKGTAVVHVFLRGPKVTPEVEHQGQKLIWKFPKLQAAVQPKAKETRPDKPSLNTRTYASLPVAGTRTGGKRRHYKGRRIDLDFKDADVHNILRLLSDVGTVNIITSDDVQGKVTIRMRDVPWDQALDVILRAKGLGQVREGNLIRVAPLSDLEKEREAEIARLRQISQLKPLETRLIPLSYARADKILDKLQYTLSPRGKLTYDDRTNMVIARDISGNLDLMERLIRNLDSQTPQVLIEARIVEARSNYSKELGIQWGGAFMASAATGNSTGLVFPNQIGIGGGATDPETPTAGILLGQAANPNFAVNLPAAASTGSGGALGLTMGSVSGNVNISLRLSAAESMGDIRIVSAPKITTLDNVEAKIEQGVTIPYSQVSAAGVQTTFRDAKLNLTVRPHVTADGSVIMAVEVTRNEPDFANTGPQGEPTILKKEAKTEMLVKDGDTAVIGGIYTTRTGRTFQKVPWFAEIPILGYLFRNRVDRSDREEVLVFITPRIINRAQSIGQ